MTHKIYLAGPMRGYPEFNQSAFKEAAAKLRFFGHEVFSPVESTHAVYGDVYTGNATGDEKAAGISNRLVFGLDLAWICKHATAVALLPGWELSRGATAEHSVAVALELVIFYLSAEGGSIYLPSSMGLTTPAVEGEGLRNAA